MSGGEIGCPLASASEHQQLLLEEKILGQESFGAAGSEEFDKASQEGGKEEENKVHAAECRAGEQYVARRRNAHFTAELGIRDPQHHRAVSGIIASQFVGNQQRGSPN